MTEGSLINMAQSADEKEEYAISESGAKRKFGYGLCLHLCEDELKKLGITEDMPVGTIVQIEAKAIVERTSTSAEMEDEGPTTERSVSLQITDMTLGKTGVAANAAEILYDRS